MSSRLAVEDCLALDLAQPAVRQVVGKFGQGRGRLTWTWAGDDVATIYYCSCGSMLELRFVVGRIARAQQIEILQSVPAFGGPRLWFKCPQTAKPVRALFLPPGAMHWASREAHGLAYRSQCARLSQFRRLLSFDERACARERRNAVRRIARANRLSSGCMIPPACSAQTRENMGRGVGG